MDLSIVIVNWHSRDFLMRCVTSVVETAGGISYEIIVIDSGSFDGSETALRRSYPEVHFIQSRSNLGFAKSNNHAAHYACGEYLLFLNPDTELRGSALKALTNAFRCRTRVGAVGGRLLNSDGSLQSTCVRAAPTILNWVLDSDYLRRRWPRSRLWGTAPLYQDGDGPRRVDAVSGACLMIRRTVFKDIGGFNEEYFMYAEDIDISHRLREAGYRNYYVPSATVVHHGGSSSWQASNTFSAVMIPEANWRFFRATRGQAYAQCFRLAMCASSLGRIAAISCILAVRLRSTARARWLAALKKWWNVLRWSCGGHELVNRYYNSDASPAA